MSARTTPDEVRPTKVPRASVPADRIPFTTRVSSDVPLRLSELSWRLRMERSRHVTFAELAEEAFQDLFRKHGLV